MMAITNRLLISVIILAWSVSVRADDEATTTAAGQAGRATARVHPDLKREVFSGRVVSMRDALKKRGIKSFDEFDNLVAFESENGELLPVIPDWRGRAFFQDKRLRDRRVDIVGYRRKDVPLLQVLMVFTHDESGERQYTDYWCDICAIPMYEIKPCDCCQADIRLRFQRRDLPEELQKSLVAPKKNAPRELEAGDDNKPIDSPGR